MIVKRSHIGGFLIVSGITATMIWGLIYFIRELWPLLPPWLALLVFILTAVMIIGYPIYALAQWSNRYLQSNKPKQDHFTVKKDRKFNRNN